MVAICYSVGQQNLWGVAEYSTCKPDTFSKKHGPEKRNSLYFCLFAHHVQCCNTTMVLCQLPVSNACSSVKDRCICIVTTSIYTLYVTLQILHKNIQKIMNTNQVRQLWNKILHLLQILLSLWLNSGSHKNLKWFIQHCNRKVMDLSTDQTEKLENITQTTQKLVTSVPNLIFNYVEFCSVHFLTCTLGVMTA